MEKFIKLSDVEALLSKLSSEPVYQHEDEDFYVGVSTVSTEIGSIKTVEFAPRTIAYWRLRNKGMFGADYACSQCGCWAQESNSGHYDTLTNFCPICGAIMTGGSNNA